tara:strand:+ start:245 stop:3760 length:3516 start_codon:yes stop_codon:yes gene_type:complete
LCVSDVDCSTTQRCDLSTGRCAPRADAGANKEWNQEPGQEPKTTEQTPDALPKENTPEAPKEAAPCTNGQTQKCYTGPANTEGVGVCKTGTQICENNTWGVCENQTLPAPEECNGKDDNCDGNIDEQLTKACYTGPAGTQDVGECKAGTQTCKEGAWQTCVGAVTPKSKEDCNGKDDNCDGQIDEKCPCTVGQTQACGSDTGECKRGTQTCEAGTPPAWGICEGNTAPSAELCNGKDDDCDGQVDENVKQACYTGPANTRGKGICQDGTQLCQAGKWSACQGSILPQSAETCDGKDEDCDGMVDEGITKSCYTGPANTRNKGICAAGTQQCAAGKWLACQGEVKPSVELCNGKDDDCNGQVDDSVTDRGALCARQQGACSGARSSLCKAGKWAPCTVADYKKTSPGFLAIELCNRKDDNCDGLIDENAPDCVISFTKEVLKNINIVAVAPNGTIHTIKENPLAWLQITPEQTITRKTLTTTGLQRFEDLRDLAVTPKGELFVTSRGGAIYKVDTTGKVSIFAGHEITNGNTNGPALTARFGDRPGIFLTNSGELYIADQNNNRIRKIDTKGVVSAVAGVGGGYLDGNLSRARFNNPTDLVVTPTGILYIVDEGNYLIRKLENGNVSTLAGRRYTGTTTPSIRDGVGLNAGFRRLDTITYTPMGILYVSDDDTIRKIDPTTQRVSTLNQRWISGLQDGPINNARFRDTKQVHTDTAGNLYVADQGNERLRKVTFSAPTACTQDGSKQACYAGPTTYKGIGICKAGQQTCVFATWSTCIGSVLPQLEACNGQDDDCDGQVDNNPVNPPNCANQQGVCAGSQSAACTGGAWKVCTNADYTKHSADYKTTESCDEKDNNCNGQVDEGAPGCVTTLAGGNQGYADGQGTAAQFIKPIALTVDASDNVYILDSNIVRKMDTNYKVTTIAGSLLFGDVDATGKQARFNQPESLTIDSAGNLYIADTQNHKIRKVTPSGVVTTLAGGIKGFQDGTGPSAMFNTPRGITIDSSGNLYVSDTGNRRIRMITPAGVVSTYAGTGNGGTRNDLRLQMLFREPKGISIDPSTTTLYVADEDVGIRVIPPTGRSATITLILTLFFGNLANVTYNKGTLYVTNNSSRICVYDLASSKANFVGSGNGYRNGQLSRALFRNPSQIVIGAKGLGYIADRDNERIRGITK